MVRKHRGRDNCPRGKRVHRSIVNPWLTVKAHNGRLQQRSVDLTLPIDQAELITTQGCLHPGCLHLPPKECNAVTEDHKQQGGLLASRKVGKLTEGSDQ